MKSPSKAPKKRKIVSLIHWCVERTPYLIIPIFFILLASLLSLALDYFNQMEWDSKESLTQNFNGIFDPTAIQKEKLLINLPYLIGLLIILTAIIMIFRWTKPSGVEKEMGELIPPARRKMPVLFNVYYRDYTASSLVLLGKIIERRRQERGNNFTDLLYKARKNLGSRIKDPENIFLFS